MAHGREAFEMSLCKLEGISFHSVKHMIKVPNFFTLPEYDDIVEDEIQLKSPPFEFCNASWEMVFKPQEKFTDEWITNVKWLKGFEIHLEKLNSYEKNHSLFCSISLMDENDKAYDKSYGNNYYLKDHHKGCVAFFVNEDRCYDKRDTLTLILHLVSSESFEIKSIQGSAPNVTRISEKTNDYKVCLSELPCTIASSVYMLKVPNFFLLRNSYDIQFKTESEPFEFANAFWQFLVRKEEDNIKVSLMRLNSKVKEHSLFFTFMQQVADNEKQKRLSRTLYVSGNKYIVFSYPISKTDHPSYNSCCILTVIVELIISETEMNAVQEQIPAIRERRI